ncbi:MAG: transporter substrate-binding protein [Ramlibacter sp.]|nr:transporter substrate-binding protein [Ramlibacter sp.]
MKSVIRLLGIASLVALGTPFAQAQTPGVTRDQVVVGSTSPQTGSVASYCKPMIDGALAWFAKVNAKGGVHGRKIVNKVLDDQYSAPQALANARQLAEEGIFAFFGGCGSMQPPAVQQVAVPAKIPYVFPNAGVPQVVPDPNFRSINPLWADQLQAVTEWAMKKHGAGRAFLVNQRAPAFDANVAGMKAGVAAGGGTIVGDEAMVVNEPDFTPLVLKMKAARPDYMIIAAAASDVARLIKTMHAQQAMPAKFILSNSALLNEAFLEPVRGLVDGKILTPQMIAAATSDKSGECTSAFKEFGAGLRPDAQSLYGCVVAQTLVAALEDAGKDLTREGFLKAIDGWNRKAVSPLIPPLSFVGGRHIGMSTMTVGGVEKGELKDIEGQLVPMPAR